MNAFEDAVERGEIDLGPFSSYHDEVCWLAAYIMLPENDEAYKPFRAFLEYPDGPTNKGGRRNIEQAIHWLKSQSADDLLPRFLHIAARHPQAMLGRLDFLVDKVRHYASWIRMMRLPIPPRPPRERTPDDDFFDYYKAQRENMERSIDRDDGTAGTISWT